MSGVGEEEREGGEGKRKIEKKMKQEEKRRERRAACDTSENAGKNAIAATRAPGAIDKAMCPAKVEVRSRFYLELHALLPVEERVVVLEARDEHVGSSEGGLGRQAAV